MFILRWLFTLSLYYWLFFIAAVIFDFCPKDTFVGKIIKQYQIQLTGNLDAGNNQNNKDVNSPEHLSTIVKMLKQYNQQQQAQQPPEEPNKPTDNNTNTNNDSLDKLLKDYITNK